MLQAIWFFIQISVVAAAAIWLTTQPGEIAISLLGYNITVQAGVFFLVLIGIVLLTVFVLRVLRGVISIPGFLERRHNKKKEQKGYRALTRGLVAVAAGDTKKATLFSKQAHNFLTQESGLSLLLAAQAARLRGEEGVAQNYFEALLKDKDAAFLGVRGLLKSAVDDGQVALALDHARQALKHQPKQPWILRLVYQLEIKNQLWDEAAVTGRKALKAGAITKDQGQSDKVAMLVLRYEETNHISYLEQAYRIDPIFVPVATAWCVHLISKKKNRSAISVFKKAWRENPHPDLVPIWDALAPEKNPKNQNKRLKWYEDLVALYPGSAEGQMAAAQAAMDMELWGEAKAYLMVAEKIYPSARVFRLRAIVEQNSTHNEDAIHDLMEKAAEALPDKKWICRETGLIYDVWSPIAQPHESFNTIIWDVPGARIVQQDNLLSASNNQFLLDPAV